jgi:hypothetical protein
MQRWKIWLVVADGPNEGDVIPVGTDRFLIGRGRGCQFRPGGAGVADLHCALLARRGRFFLRNGQVPDGTSLGGRRVLGAMELRDGDRFQVGDWQLQVRIVPCALVEPPPADPAPLDLSATPLDTELPVLELADEPADPAPLNAQHNDERPAPTDPPRNETSETICAPTVAGDAGPVAAPEAPSEPVTDDATRYLRLDADESQRSARERPAPAVPSPVARPSPPPESKTDPSTDRSPARPSILIGRKDRAMPVIRQRAWNAATQPQVVVKAAPPRKTWKNWLPAAGGLVLGMLVVWVFYLTSLRAATPLATPPRGRLHTGRAVAVQQDPVPPAGLAPGQRHATAHPQAAPEQRPVPQNGPRVRHRGSPTTNP